MKPIRKTKREKPRRRQLALKAAAVLTPFALAALLELALNLGGYGYGSNVIEEYPYDNKYLVFNREASAKYFNGKASATSGNAELFMKEKPAGTIRIFVLGESTTIGFPYFHNGSFHRWLQYRLMLSFPDKDFEVINLSLTAVNSFAIAGFAKEISRYRPDAVLIYAGQNEYYGAMGAASTYVGSAPFINILLKMRELKTVQLLASLPELFNKNESSGRMRTRMEIMAGNRLIARNSRLYKRGVEQFACNMNAAIRRLGNKGIPVLVSNLVSNVKDLPPLSGDEAGSNADSLFNSAATHYRAGNYLLAGELYTAAKDDDQLRFRAPEELNAIITELCARYDNAHLVDAKALFVQHSPHGILGNELFTDHVHPNLFGYSLLASAFYQKLLETGVAGKEARHVTEREWRAGMPVSPIDSIAGEFRIMQLKSHWPFNDPAANRPIPESSIEEQLAAKLFRREENWLDVHNALYLHYQRSLRAGQATKISEGAALEYASDPAFQEKAAMDNAESGNLETASIYMRKSFRSSPDFEKARTLFIFTLMMDKPSEAKSYFASMEQYNSGKMNLNSLKEQYSELCALSDRYNGAYPDSVQIAVAKIYFRMGNATAALKYVNKILETDPGNRDAMMMKGKLE
ncbi:MAG: GDSL-type esterase/lipase family protein [Tannerellaceae bacterium]|jgi:tetratricopeptide (TPR) repeat protein|nr:GDSL-type esterase/lipase family protein [Tannerellaceae bacterium]